MGDYYDRYWRSRDYSDDDRREGGGRRSRRTRFDKYRVTGMMLLFFGIGILALGIYDVGWTTSRYGDNCQPNVNYPNLCPGNHIFVYIGSPLWGGALLICAAFVALSTHPDKATHYAAHWHFLVLIGINMVITLPAVIVLNILEILMNKGTYWMYDATGHMQIYDNLQFGLPIAIIVMAGLALNVVLFFVVFLYCCAEDKHSYQKRSRRYQGYDGPEQGDSYRGQRIPPRDPYRYQGGGYPGYGGGYGGGRRYYYN